MKKFNFKIAAILIGLFVGNFCFSFSVQAQRENSSVLLGEGIVWYQEEAIAKNSLTEAPEVAVKSGDLNRADRAKKDIIEKFKSITEAGEQIYAVVPNIKNPYQAGELTTSFLQNGLSYLNFIRYSAGLYDVALSEEYNESAQYGAVLLAANNELTHYPQKPADMSESFFQKGREATSSSNISGRWGFHSVALNSTISGCMDDFGSANALCMGHRRWLLNPDLGKVGFGYAQNEEGAIYMSTKIFDWSGQEMDYDFIAWPASGYFASEAITPGASWSITLNPDKYQIPSKNDLLIKVTRNSDNKQWIFDKNTSSDVGNGYGEKAYYLINTDGYGVSNSIIFNLGNANENIYKEDTYFVSVEGLKSTSGKEVSLQYEICFIQAADLEMAPLELTIKNSQEYKLKVQSNSSVYPISAYDVIWTSSNPEVASVEDGYVDAFLEGTAIITASYGNRKAQCKVVVVPAGISMDTEEIILQKGQGVALEVSAFDYSYSWYDAAWSSSDTKVATVSNMGVLEGVGKGSAMIRVSYGEEVQTCKVMVESSLEATANGNQNSEGNGSNTKDNLYGEETDIELKNGWYVEFGKEYWYEDGIKQGLEGRGKEIYDPRSDAWYWLDKVQGGAKAVSKDVYQESNGGKWVRYDAQGRMVKGWQITQAGTYYFDPITGAMAKGSVVLENLLCYFDEITGIGLDHTWRQEAGKWYWYENGKRQGYDLQNSSYRGKEIYDPQSDAWYWLDNIQQGAKAVSKDVYQESNGGKWVRYDAQGKMIKGWQTTQKGTYYFDPITGAMAKGFVKIDKRTYYFNEITGILGK